MELHPFGGYCSLYLRPECGGTHTKRGEVHIAIYRRNKEFGLLVISMLETNDSDGTSIGRVHRRCMRRYLECLGLWVAAAVAIHSEQRPNRVNLICNW